MRPDFGKCVIERSRRGSSSRGAKARWYGKFVVDKEDGSVDYEGPMKLPSSMNSRFHEDSKSFTDVLGPIEGYLRSSCGRKWDDVYSELAQLLGKASWSLRHIMTQHLDVAVNTYISKSGHICNASKYGPQFIEPTIHWRRADFYVDPRSGILKEWPHKEKEPKLPSKKDLEYFAEPGAFYMQVDGLWFRHIYVAEPAVEIPRNDAYAANHWRNAKRYVEPTFPDYRDGATVYRAKRQKSLNKKEIKAMLARRDAKLRQKFPAYK